MREDYSEKVPWSVALGYTSTLTPGANWESSTKGTKTNTRFRSGGDNPGYKEQISRHVNATTNFQGAILDHNLQESNVTIRGNVMVNGISDARTYYLRGDITGRSLSPMQAVDPSLIESTSRKAHIGFLTKVDSITAPFKAGVTLGEWNQTMRMIAHPFRSLADSIRKYAAWTKYRISRPGISRKEKQKIITDTYLEYAFGWAPLVGDIEGGMAAYKAMMDKRETIRVTFRSEESPDASQVSFLYAASPIFLNLNKVTKVTLGVTIRGAVYHNIEGGPSVGARSWGANVDTFLPTVWELIPYSFIVDYFSNIGKVLTAVAVDKARLAWTCESRVTISEQTISGKADTEKCLNAVGGWSGKGVNQSIAAASAKSKLVTRGVPLFSVGIEDVKFKLPAFWSQQTLNLIFLSLAKCQR